MHVDQPGQQRALAQVDALRLWWQRVALATDTRDTAGDDVDLRAFHIASCLHIQQAGGGDDGGLGVRAQRRARATCGDQQR